MTEAGDDSGDLTLCPEDFPVGCRIQLSVPVTPDPPRVAEAHRVTENRRKTRAGLVAIRIGARVYWVPTETARWVESISKQMAEHVASRSIVGIEET
jgi:hypothetical protein